MLEASSSQYATPAAVVAAAPCARSHAIAATVRLSLWLPVVSVAMVYPFALRWFVAAVHAAQAGAGNARVLWSLGALAMLALALAAPALSLRALYAIRRDTSTGAIAVRRLLHLGVAVPPFYLLCIRVVDLGALVDGAANGLIAWWGVWLVLSALAWNTGRGAAAAGLGFAAAAATDLAGDRSARSSPMATGRWRRYHLVIAAVVLATFLVAHLVNHVAAVWSIPAQEAVMHALRAWYRANWVEPVILALFVVAMVTGLWRFDRLIRGPSDGYRVLQTASGCYLVFFLMSHVWAALGARYHDIDTNWAFASGGRAGMLASGVAAGILLYYTGSLFAVAAHTGLGLRMALLSRRVQAAAANRSLWFVVAFGVALSALIIAALLGVRLGG